ncbi:MAG: HD domain-containing protein [Acidobacteria bacterium]|nr:HD domain-containing protein [Acidobacteriota bacterium]MCW5950563.1 HD domain-containing protein [Pyrinomonadaceae bacterium]
MFRSSPPMPAPRKISLIYFVIATLLLVGMLPLVVTGWLLSERSAKELRAAENRYQIQLVQEKARQMEVFSGRISEAVGGLATALEISKDPTILASAAIEAKLAEILKQNPDIAALYIKPAAGDSLSVFRTEQVNRAELDAIAVDSEKHSASRGIAALRPVRIGPMRMPVMPFVAHATINGAPSATIIAVASMSSISQSVVGLNAVNDEDLWQKGLPIVFVVDASGNSVFHPDPAIADAGRSMTNIKIVEEWIDSGKQVQSALVPFDAEYNGVGYHMIGAYSTARLGGDSAFGVIAMQDEAKALASVSEMRTQTWMISLAFALLALVVGSVGARYMTAPLMSLVDAAKRIADGDHSSRAKIKSVTEVGSLGETFDLMADQIEEQIAKLAKAAEENRELFVGTVKALAAAIDGKDKYTRGHSERVARISVAIGRRMNLPEDELETLRISALLHDVGKIAIDDNILKKPAALTDEEFEIMKQHPVRGYKIMSQIPAMKEFLPGMYMHHEMVNGKGYPQGLKGSEIPLQAKIVSVADTFDAMTIDRPYQKGMELAAALDRLRDLVGTRYQYEVVEALVAAVNAGEIGQGIIRQLAEKRAAEASAAENAAASADTELGPIDMPGDPLPLIPQPEAQDERMIEYDDQEEDIGEPELPLTLPDPVDGEPAEERLELYTAEQDGLQDAIEFVYDDGEIKIDVTEVEEVIVADILDESQPSGEQEIDPLTLDDDIHATFSGRQSLPSDDEDILDRLIA